MDFFVHFNSLYHLMNVGKSVLRPCIYLRMCEKIWPVTYSQYYRILEFCEFSYKIKKFALRVYEKARLPGL